MNKILNNPLCLVKYALNLLINTEAYDLGHFLLGKPAIFFRAIVGDDKVDQHKHDPCVQLYEKQPGRSIKNYVPAMNRRSK